METNYLNRFGGTGTDHRIFPEAELWTAVILQAIDDLDRRTSLSPSWARDSAREWLLRTAMWQEALFGLVTSSMWIQVSFAHDWPRNTG
jgi:hypothetical protein